MQITALEPQARHADRWNLSFDGSFAFALDGTVVVREGLAVGQELSPAEVERLRGASAEEDLASAALRFLAPRPRSRAEVRQRLLRPRPKRPAPDHATVERVLDRLEALGLLNDRGFAEFWVENRERFSPRSARALGVELRQRGVDRETVEATANPDRDAERALTAGRQKLRVWTGLDYQTFRDRMGPFLLRRGFSYAVARAAVRQLWQESGGDGAASEETES